MRPHLSSLMFALAGLAAGISPLLPNPGAAVPAASSAFPGWPQAYDGRALQPLPLSAREVAFAQDFPGRIARFSDGRREIIIRWVDAATRKLHPAADCFRGIGFTVTPGPLRRDASGRAMGCFRATREGEALRVCEGLHGETGESWPDVSQWYWDAMLGGSAGPWWSIVVAEGEVDTAGRQ